MRLRIGQLAPPFESVPPSGYGGTERVVSTLTEELVRRGHGVTLFAAADSQTSARLVPIVDQALWHHDPPCDDFTVHRPAIFEAILDEIDTFDIVHSHLDFRGFPLANAARRTMLTTSFGSVMPEALACGTPVLALRKGSVPEVLENGVTGFMCHFEDELVPAVDRIGDLDRFQCRSEAERRFSPASMADAYERDLRAVARRFKRRLPPWR